MHAGGWRSGGGFSTTLTGAADGALTEVSGLFRVRYSYDTCFCNKLGYVRICFLYRDSDGGFWIVTSTVPAFAINLVTYGFAFYVGNLAEVSGLLQGPAFEINSVTYEYEFAFYRILIVALPYKR